MKKGISFHVVNLDRCNQRCLFCMKKADIEKDLPISEDQIIKEILLAKKNKLGGIDFFGGEPLLFPFLKRMLVLAEKFKMKSLIATNAVLFSSDKFASDFFRGLDVGNIAVRTSMHSDRAAGHDRITQIKGSHRRTVQGIKNVVKNNTQVFVNVVVTRLNYKDLPRIAEFIYGLGATGVKFSGLIPQGEILNHPELLIAEAEVEKYIIAAVKAAIDQGFSHIEVEKVSQQLAKKLEGLGEIRFIDIEK